MGFATVGVDEVVESWCWVVGEGVVVLDRRADRLVVFDREGKYERQMLWDQLGAVSDMVVYENRILLLLGSEVYELGW